ncbi:hypothetical protein DBR32_03080 [Taibaiella sp. KBW10]|uniref:hypothetical protein n=1 Tax=Taibaiella sp. KBW10 TaxID=2153357 RepID=UPI000F591FC3|nr:hypothetical protein [Taibaiella sp. KBW10]RQO32593.1 hypothetical protein DBR32_03080 [Taibaiella sp. KBW10]
MRKFFILGAFTMLMGCLQTTTAQAQQGDDANIINADKFSEQQLAQLEKHIPTDGWVLLTYQGRSMIVNCSNKDYRLNIGINCKSGKTAPYFMIEYSNSYRDGDWGGLDYAKSKEPTYAELKVSLDGKSFGNPFATKDKALVQQFADALKTAKKLSMSFYDMEMNPDLGKEAPKLNRTIEFKMAHPALLETRVECNN